MKVLIFLFLLFLVNVILFVYDFYVSWVCIEYGVVEQEW